MMMISALVIVFCWGCGGHAAKYDFGLMENEPLLRELCQEDRDVHRELLRLNSLYKSVQLDYYVKHVYGSISSTTVKQYIKHPTNAYNLIKRSSVSIKELALNLNAENTEDSDKISEALRAKLVETAILDTVTDRDMSGAVKGLLIITHTYDTDIEKFRRGEFVLHQDSVVTTFKTETKLRLDDLCKLAEAALEMGFINTAAKYVQSAVNAANEERVEEARMKKILTLKNKVLIIHNGLLTKTKTYLTDKQITYPYYLDDQLNKREKQPKFVEDLRRQQYNLSLITKNEGDFFDMQRMMDGCRGFNSLRLDTVPAIRNDLKCMFVHHSDPYVKLGPFKIEFAGKSPHICVFHQILTEEDINHFIEFATPRLSRNRGDKEDAYYGRREKEEGKLKQIYKSVQARMKTIAFAGTDADVYTPNNFTILDRRAENLSSRMEKALNLNVTNQWSSGQYQVTNYGLAGLCEAHLDPHGYLEGADVTGRNYLKKSGDYIGTVMGWLQDPPAGGSTTFFKYNTEVRIQPTRGSAAFWFSLYTDGVRDPASSHGGCPVAVGDKWILNKWIYSFNNWDRQPCHPRQSKKFQYEKKVRMSWPESSYYH